MSALTDANGTPYPEDVQEAHALAAQVIISDLLVAQLRDEERITAEAEKRGAAKALRMEAERGFEAVEAAKTRESPFRDFAVHLMTGLSQELERRADAIESGEVTLPD
jgi:hypothetical protein